ncbi:hypothetical protein CXF85_19200 [Colwellia sp. 75C3]|uniref:intermembrane phospholipid transport protein YdbH family protein n=1 Tax=Colwellia sp. 75C3 TaxID=888425 RepID=UPI000C33A139|nr:YdbH domain-containing protein [Colwellia sp. 75C3]PKG81643.1 hypothetical protein CXF85_19200 [Colwellia sp. 75C3]
MRLFKFTLAICLVIAITLSSVFYARNSVVTSLVNNYLTQHNAVLTCIDFTLNSDLDLVISHLCIDSPYADIELIDSLIVWRFEANNIAVNKLSEAISAISIAAVNVRAKADLSFPESAISAKSTVKLSELPVFIRKQFDDLALLSPPVDIDIKTFNYQPFSESQNQSYQGRFSMNAQQLNFFLANQKQEPIFSFELVKKGQNISANVETDLTRLRSLLINHKTAFPPSLSSLLIDETWFATGNVTSQFNWQNKILSMKNQVTGFSFDASKNFASLESVKSDTIFTWQTNLTAEHLHFDFTNEHHQGSNQENNQSNNIELAFNSVKLIELLTAQGIDQQLINLIVDNAIDTLTIKPIGSLNVDFSNETITSDGIDIFGSNLNEPIQLSFNDLAFNYSDDVAITVNMQKAKFSLAGYANISQLKPYSSQQVKLNVVGEIEQQSEIWQLTLGQGTVIELAQLSLPSAKSTDITISKARPRIKSLISHWQGNVVLNKNDDVTFELEISNQLSKLSYPNIIQVNDLELTAEVSGGINDITIAAKVVADNVPIGIAQITGELRNPSVVISAQDVLLTDLLALQVKLPVELKLIDGTIDYRLSGQVNNREDLMANSMSLAIKVQDLTGEVDGTWLQELNWQQNFTVKGGQIKTLRDGTLTSNNLTIAKIETATPIHNLSTTTAIDFSQNTLKLLVHNTWGNLLGGRFDIVKAQWPFNKALPINVKLTKIDLEKLLELDKKQGIVVTGKVSGELPIFYDGEHFLIKEGGLKNVGDGIIQVYNNPAVEELKGTSTELKLAFDALENLHYHHLSSKVSMGDDGYMLLVTAIKGRNPDLDNEVNLNLNLSYDLLGLLESLNITEHFESKVLKGLQH